MQFAVLIVLAKPVCNTRNYADSNFGVAKSGYKLFATTANKQQKLTTNSQQQLLLLLGLRVQDVD